MSSSSNLHRREQGAAVNHEHDRVFIDDYAGQLATTAGSVSGGLTMKLNLGV